MPGFTLTPVQAATSVARVTPFVQMQVGTTPVAKPSKAISDDGWFNFVTTGRLTRFQINCYGPAQLALGEVQNYITGQV
jgi:hypothetical protein